ncbi:MAG TPA: glycosyltransferase [Actinomycetota bacterium]|nr:glycosyltransferase [Actinomycetota bacterium]
MRLETALRDARRASESPAHVPNGAVRVDGKFLTLDGAPFHVKGVTYGSFKPRLDGALYPDRYQIKTDLVEMAAAGVNVVRTYTLPPPELLELAAEAGLRVLVGLDYRDWRYEEAPSRAAHRRVLDAGRREIERALEVCAGRPEVLALSVGNEVPCDVVRAHGIARVEDGLSELVAEVHAGDPETLVTYCNFPTTEFLRIEGQDLTCFNVFLERSEDFRRYLLHLQTISEDRPLLVTELGLAANVHGEDAHARLLGEQLRIVDECGVAGATVFSWTDEWGVAGEDVVGWEFGITDRERRPKAALHEVRRWTASGLRDVRDVWPRLSVVVCVYNGAALLAKCLHSLQALDYPDLEVIVCDDGSTDGSLEIARGFPFVVLPLERVGLSRARNEGIARATGEIVAFLDSDAFCHPEWPYHLALSLEEQGVRATGGPNLPVPGVGVTEQAVALSPGSPMEVLIADTRAEHVPGCNMAYERDALVAVGGFNPIYTAAGDDVDVCWKILDAGWHIAFSPAAQVRHHRRDTVSGYLKQQRGYGRAEALLAPHHRHRFNRLGQARWTGVVYGGPSFLPRLLRPLVYHGYSGTAAYQPVARRRSECVRDWGVALMPLLFLAMMVSGLGSLVSLWWLAPFAVTGGAIAGFAAFVAAGVKPPRTLPRSARLRAQVALFHVLQPLVRTWGRLKTRVPHVPPAETPWSGDRVRWLHDLERHLAETGHRVRFGDVHSPWDLEVNRWSPITWRLTAAVLWGWTPVARVRPGVRVRALVPAVVALGIASAWSGWGIALWGVAIALAAQEAVRVRLGISRTLRATTRCADA